MRAWSALFACISIQLFLFVSKTVDYPYMDEFFHVRQTLQYINERDFTTWDPKITTPPGLYAVGYLTSYYLGSSLTALRSVNLIPVLVLLHAPNIFPSSGPQSAISKSSKILLICGFPLFAFYTNLYYTDIWSTLLVLCGLNTSCPINSAILLFISLWFRQTNIIWAGVAAAYQIVDHDLALSGVFSNIRVLTSKLMRKGLPYVLVALLFAGFLKWNGSIALGDQSNHGVSLHFAQLLYYGLFFMMFSAPLALESVLKGGKARIRQTFGRIGFIPFEIVAICLIIRYGTIVHPFILSDNRHYTFYIWRRLISPMGGYLMVPFYWATWRWFAHTVDFALVRTWIYLLATAAVLIPSPLMEPRYYIVPYLIWRIQLYGKEDTNLENFYNAGINCATVSIFCLSETHFMW